MTGRQEDQQPPIAPIGLNPTIYKQFWDATFLSQKVIIIWISLHERKP